jgi:uncharacterized Zn finger protein
MKCPVCKQVDYGEQGLHATGLNETIVECDICGTVWSVSHGRIEVIKDPQQFSFLQASSENVEADDYNYAGV